MIQEYENSKKTSEEVTEQLRVHIETLRTENRNLVKSNKKVRLLLSSMLSEIAWLILRSQQVFITDSAATYWLNGLFKSKNTWLVLRIGNIAHVLEEK